VRALVLLFLTIPILPLTSLHADELIGRKPGVWEVKVSYIPLTAPSFTGKVCLDADIARNMLQSEDCKFHHVNRDGNRIFIEAACRVNRTNVESKATVTFISDSAYHVDIDDRYDPPVENRSEMIVAQDAKWLGPCPAGVKPGDMIDDQGKVAN
jgi:hypothetical protein